MQTCNKLLAYCQIYNTDSKDLRGYAFRRKLCDFITHVVFLHVYINRKIITHTLYTNATKCRPIENTEYIKCCCGCYKPISINDFDRPKHRTLFTDSTAVQF